MIHFMVKIYFISSNDVHDDIYIYILSHHLKTLNDIIISISLIK
jgi:hypothetical protein